LSDFQTALKLLDTLEGGYVNDKNDVSGPTASGISLRFLQSVRVINTDFNQDGVINIEDLKVMTGFEREELFLKCFWQPMNLTKIVDQRVANLLFCQGVNCGPMTATKFAQKAIKKMVPRLVIILDGKLGPITINCINARLPTAFINAYKAINRDYYYDVVTHNPSQIKFIKGWMNRLAQI
jgi:lysozyme family protein